jgi:hypothetical protein
MKNLAALVLMLVVVVGFGCASAQMGAISRAQSGMEKGKFKFALRRLSVAEKYCDPKPSIKAEIVYLKGVCIAALDKIADARAMFQYVTNNFPDTEFGYQAKAKLADDPALRTSSSPFQDYDAKFVRSVRSRWYELMKPIKFKRKQYRGGIVTTGFDLQDDGKITNFAILNNTTTEMLAIMCEKAVLEPSPYDNWPADLRMTVGKPYRRITFTFYYLGD